MCAYHKTCCSGIKRFTIGDPNISDEVPPILGAEGDYGFATRMVWYCPSCGMQFLKDDYVTQLADSPDFCCSMLEGWAEGTIENDWMYQIFYQPFTRRYFFAMAPRWREDEPEGTLYKEWDFYYCLYCGKKLPESLLDVWLETVQKEFAIAKQEPLEKMLPSLPEEFKTDLWWKKRGL